MAAEERAKLAKDQADTNELMNEFDDMTNEMGIGEDYQDYRREDESEETDERFPPSLEHGDADAR